MLSGCTHAKMILRIYEADVYQKLLKNIEAETKKKNSIRIKKRVCTVC